MQPILTLSSHNDNAVKYWYVTLVCHNVKTKRYRFEKFKTLRHLKYNLYNSDWIRYLLENYDNKCVIVQINRYNSLLHYFK